MQLGRDGAAGRGSTGQLCAPRPARGARRAHPPTRETKLGGARCARARMRQRVASGSGGDVYRRAILGGKFKRGCVAEAPPAYAWAEVGDAGEGQSQSSALPLPQSQLDKRVLEAARRVLASGR